MVARLQNVRFDQIYPDNDGGPEFDTDGDGQATQEDEFVSFTNDGTSAIDVSGWQVWSDSTGVGAPDAAQDGLYHTFPQGTVLQPGETLYIINEVSGAEKDWQQESSEGGQETGAGGVSSNFLTEGNSGSPSESIALVNPNTGDFIVFNMSTSAEQVSSQPGFPGTTKVGEVDGDAVQDDAGAGYSYQYDEETDSYVYREVFVPCFTPGTLISTPSGDRPVESLRPGDLVCTRDAGAKPLRAILRRNVDFRTGDRLKHLPIEFKPGSLGPARPNRRLIVSPQHRMLLSDPSGREYLAPAKALVDRPGVRVMSGRRHVTYIQLVFDSHEIVLSEGAPTESFHPGNYVTARCSGAMRRGLRRILPEGALTHPCPARPLLTPAQVRQLPRSALRPAGPDWGPTDQTAKGRPV
ncbi:hypothetical protein JANAI62_14000 [Jannaschia pagri]|uniref:LTD domain-containing protein n=1 Tax=Jannaschia pagri TaxID=2829797 RepID=A0ABQ4NK33_9RHOB|nr:MULTISPECIES: Hint domain-containing protein [unclassified Jannaschia]GIT94777.1 hypothetical protein JANAI62_14000 [Jannaschia sp. AI_62]